MGKHLRGAIGLPTSSFAKKANGFAFPHIPRTSMSGNKMRLFTFFLFFTKAASMLAAAPDFTPLFVEDGPPRGWIVRHWADIANQPEQPSPWMVKEGVLHGSDPRGTWLISEREYSDFILEFDF